MPGEVLRVTSGPAAGLEIRPTDELRIGRATATEEGRLGNDPELSRDHARITRRPDGRLEVEDLGSTNGSFVNGAQVTAPRVLEPGDVLQLGSSELQVVGTLGDVLQPTVRRPGLVGGLMPAPAAAPDAIEVAGLVRQYPKGPRAVDGIDLRVRRGEIYGFLGPNGAGKSTTVHMLTTLLRPTAGRALVAGHDVARDPAKVRASIGAALQEAALDPALTGWEHMTLVTGLQGVRKAQRRERAAALIERVGLTYAAGRRVGSYSGGMKRRLDLALALVHSPQVLFLDEPTTGLDPKSRADLWDEVLRLAREEGVTVFLTTQYLEEADQLADRVGIIERGKIVAEGTPEALKAEIGQPTVELVPSREGDRAAIAALLERFGEPTSPGGGRLGVRLATGVEDITDIVRALDAEGMRIANLSLHAPTLDDVFLAKTGRSLETEPEEAEGDEAAATPGPAATGQLVGGAR